MHLERLFDFDYGRVMLQSTLFGTLPFGLANVSERVRRTMLDDECWVDHVDGWVTGADDLYLKFRRTFDWRTHKRWIMDREVVEPRLSTGIKQPSPELRPMATSLDRHYGLGFIASWANLYRDGSDSVAWHGDRFRPGAVHETVALVSLGGPRTIRIRPRGGGPSLPWSLASGDLLVMGGPTQHRFEHCVPKTGLAAARISVAFRCQRGREFDPSIVDGLRGRQLETSRL